MHLKRERGESLSSFRDRLSGEVRERRRLALGRTPLPAVDRLLASGEDDALLGHLEQLPADDRAKLLEDDAFMRCLWDKGMELALGALAILERRG